jgi:hypothetical protein
MHARWLVMVPAVATHDERRSASREPNGSVDVHETSKTRLKRVVGKTVLDQRRNGQEGSGRRKK